MTLATATPAHSEAIKDAQSLLISEMFFSIQGESTYAGRPCIFIRLTGCHLRCTYCDTVYSYAGGKRFSIDETLAAIGQWDCRLVEITGGEPLLQAGCVTLARLLLDRGYEVLLETSGAEDISVVDNRVARIMDLKCPASGEAHRNRWENLEHLTARDEVKFVIADRGDYEWARDMFWKHLASKPCAVLFSPVFEKMKNRELSEWILADHLPVRFQIQLHKYIWDPQTRGV